MKFYVKRFLLVTVIAFAVIAGAHLLRGRAVDHATREALRWSVLSSCIYMGALARNMRRARTCKLCSGPHPVA